MTKRQKWILAFVLVTLCVAFSGYTGGMAGVFIMNLHTGQPYIVATVLAYGLAVAGLRSIIP